MTEELGTLGSSLRTDPRYHRVHRLSLLRGVASAAPFIQAVQFPDISFYQGVVDFDVMRTKTRAVVIRAGQNLWVDTQFSRNYAEAKRVGLLRGIYYFYDDRVHPLDQAEVLIRLLKAAPPEMEIYVDWEKTYGGAFTGLHNVVLFMKAVETAILGSVVGMYTGYYWFREHSDPVKNAVEYAYLATHPLWLAWYTSNVSYVLVPTPWTAMTFWQYGTPAIGATYGVQTFKIDMNWFNGSAEEFERRYGSGTTVPPEVHTVPFPGVAYHQFTRFGSRINACVVGTDYRWHVTKFGQRKVSDVARSLGAIIASNGGDYNEYGAVGLHASEGIEYSPQSEWEPFVHFSKDNLSSIERFDSRQRWNDLAGKRILVLNGQVSPDNSNSWFNHEPRTIAGVTTDGRTILFTADGRQFIDGVYTDGITLFEAAQVAIELGAFTAIDLDGGGSSALWVKDKIVNVPIDSGVPGQERFVGTHIVLLPKGVTMRYDAVSANYNMSLREDHNTFAVTLVGIPKNTVVHGDFLWVAPADGTEVKAGDKWLHQVTYAGFTGWVAIVHKGVTLMTLTDNGPGTVTKLPFTFKLQGFKLFTGELEPE